MLAAIMCRAKNIELILGKMTFTKISVNWKYTSLRVILFCISCAIILILFSPVTKNLPEPWSEILLGSIAVIAVFILSILFSNWEKLTLTDIGIIPTKQTLPLFVYGFCIGLLLASVQGLLVVTFSSAQVILAPQTPFLSILFTLFLYLILALREELAFRGYALRSLAYSIGSWKAQFIIILIFSLEHLAGGYTLKQAFLGAGIGALLFGIAALKSKGIALPVGIHAAWNFGQWSIGFKNEPGIWQTIIEKGGESNYEKISFVFYLIVMIIAITCFIFYDKIVVRQQRI